MSKTVLNAHNVLVFLLHHIKKLRADSGTPQIVTANHEIWQRAVYTLRLHCNSLLLHVFPFTRRGLIHFSAVLEKTLDDLPPGTVSRIATTHDTWDTVDFILRDELTNITQHTRVTSTTNPDYYENALTADPNIREDTQAMFDETRELAAQLLPLIDERVEAEINKQKPY